MDSRKVFIYNGFGTGPLSTEDLHTLFTSETIFPSRPDVTLSEFNFNMTGLTNPVFVVPGGSTLQIAHKLKSPIGAIKSHFKEDFGYIGVCAGAFLGAAEAELYLTTHELDSHSGQFEVLDLDPPKKMKIAFNMIENYRAVGSFYPSQCYLGIPPKEFVPYRVSLAFDQTELPLSQLYLQGPAFFSSRLREEKSCSKVIATYAGYEKYHLFNSHLKPSLGIPAAIVHTPAQEKRGGRLLAATHIETCVKQSKLLAFFKENIPEKDYNVLISEQKQAQHCVENLLRDTLKLA